MSFAALVVEHRSYCDYVVLGEQQARLLSSGRLAGVLLVLMMFFGQSVLGEAQSDYVSSVKHKDVFLIGLCCGSTTTLTSWGVHQNDPLTWDED